MTAPFPSNVQTYFYYYSRYVGSTSTRLATSISISMTLATELKFIITLWALIILVHIINWAVSRVSLTCVIFEKRSITYVLRITYVLSKVLGYPIFLSKICLNLK